MSPLSDTTNLAPAMAGGELFSHIRYMAMTTIPTILITLLVFIIIGFSLETKGDADTKGIMDSIEAAFNINGWLFLVPLVVIFMIIRKTPPLVALLIGTLLGGVFALIFQPGVVAGITGATQLDFESGYKGILNAITVSTSIETDSTALNALFAAKGMNGMLGTIWLIVCAMVFGGIMDGIGALSRITKGLLSLAKSTFSLFASTVGSCIALNVTASDQYLAIVVPGKMFSKAYEDRGLAPENLSRTLEDSGTVTSVLIPWNTCGAYMAATLGVATLTYLPYTFFNMLCPIIAIFYGYWNIGQKRLEALEPAVG